MLLDYFWNGVIDNFQMAINWKQRTVNESICIKSNSFSVLANVCRFNQGTVMTFYVPGENKSVCIIKTIFIHGNYRRCVCKNKNRRRIEFI